MPLMLHHIWPRPGARPFSIKRLEPLNEARNFGIRIFFLQVTGPVIITSEPAEGYRVRRSVDGLFARIPNTAEALEAKCVVDFCE